MTDSIVNIISQLDCSENLRISPFQLIVSICLNEWMDRQEEYFMEAGDILWQLAGLCYVMGWKLDDVAQKNLDKLASRKQRGVIDGDGDNR